MLKIFVGIFLLVSASCPADAQSHRVYLTGSGEITSNAQLALSYVNITQLREDSAWFARQFDLKDTLLSTGYYKDAELKIPHGKFTYYGKASRGPGLTFMGKVHVDTINYIHFTGYYINGVKTGTWIEYYPGGLKSTLRTYKNNVLEGLFQKYSNSGKVSTEGYYVKNKKEGDWNQLDEDSTVMFTTVFKHDKLVGHTDMVEFEKLNRHATPKFDLQKYLSHIVKHYTYPISSGQLTISFKVTKDGAVINPNVEKSYEPQFDKMIIQAISNSTRWEPGLKKGQPLTEVRCYTVNIVNSALQSVLDETLQLHPEDGMFTY